MDRRMTVPASIVSNIAQWSHAGQVPSPAARRTSRLSRQQPFQRIALPDAVVIHVRVVVEGEQEFRIMVPDILQGPQFPVQGCRDPARLPTLGCIGSRQPIWQRSPLPSDRRARRRLQIRGAAIRDRPHIFQRVPNIHRLVAEHRSAKPKVNQIVFFSKRASSAP